MFRMLVRAGCIAWGVVSILGNGSPSFAVAEVDVTGQLRLRYEGDDRSFVAEAEFGHVVLQRTRLQVRATNEKGAEIVVQAQDSRAWGDEGAVDFDAEGLDIHQAYARIEDPFGFVGVDFFAGRQELAYGNQRIIGDGDWTNTAQAFDAARIRINMEENWIDVGGARVSDAAFATNHEIFAFIYGHYAASSAGFVLEPTVAYRDLDTQSVYQTTLGEYAEWSQGRFKVWEDFYYQTGRSSGGDLGAYLFALDLAADLSGRADDSFGLGAGFALLTGDDPAQEDDSPFDTMYDDDHWHYGYMDIAEILAGDDGLRDIHLKVWANTQKELMFKGAFHLFSTDNDSTLPTGGDGNDLGKEFDLIMQKDLDEGMLIELGGGIFLPGDLVEFDTGDETAYWAYVQGNVDF